MATVLIIGLIVAVVALLIAGRQQSKTIQTYESELIKKARKGRKNAAK